MEQNTTIQWGLGWFKEPQTFNRNSRLWVCAYRGQSGQEEMNLRLL